MGYAKGEARPWRTGGKKGTRKLSTVEEEVLTMIVVGQRMAKRGLGVPPSQKEIATWMGWSSSYRAAEVLKNLERKGYIRRTGARSRAIEVLR